MKIENSSKWGFYCPTSAALFNTANLPAVKSLEILEMNPYQESESFELIEINLVAKRLVKMGKEMLAISPHPSSNTLVGIPGSALNGLQVLAARIEDRSTSRDIESLAETSQQEVDLAKELSDMLTPVVEKIVSNEISAEEVMEAIHSHPSPMKARKFLHTLLTSDGATMLGDRVLTVATNEVLDSKVILKGHGSIKIQLDPINIFRDDRLVEGRLIDLLEATSLFLPENLGRAQLKLTVRDVSDMRLLSEASAYRVKVELQVALDVILSANKIQYSGEVVRILKKDHLRKALDTAKEREDRSLFE